ncbi:MAG: hypothetical protein ACOH1Q_08990 [Thiobacillus sp.]
MFPTEAQCYLRERILNVRIGLLWLLLLAGVALAARDGLGRLPVLALASALFIIAFRLWDDLADRENDRLRHPQRCLVNSINDGPFYAVVCLLLATLTSLVALLTDGSRVLIFLGLLAAFLGVYRRTRNRPDLRPLRTVLVLAKYPVFVLLLARHPDNPVALLAAFGVYLPPLLDEARSVGPGIFPPAAILMGLLVLVWLGLTI